MPGKPLIVEAVAVEAMGRTQSVADERPTFETRDGPLRPLQTNRVYTGDAFHAAPVYAREDLRPGDAINGPSILRERNATTVIEPAARDRHIAPSRARDV